MRKVREVLRLKHVLKLTERQIERSVGISHGTVGRYLKRAEEAGLVWEEAEKLSDGEVEARLFNQVGRNEPVTRAPIDFGWVHTELHRAGVTLELLWTEYMQAVAEGGSGRKPYQYSQFCELYREYKKKLSPVMRQTHIAGKHAFIDFSGKRPRLFNGETGEFTEVELFVMVLGASSYTYAEAVRTQTLPDFVGATVRGLEYFGGVTEILVPDQLRSAVSKPDRSEPEINATYAEMAQHYGTAVVPARPRKPKDKGYASHYTSFVLSDGTRGSAAPGELSSLLLRECPCARLGVEARALVVVALGVQQTMFAPLLHGRDRDVQHPRDLVSGEHPGGAQMIEAALEPVLATQPQHHLGVKGESFTGAVATLVQDDRDLLVGVALGQLLEFAEDVRRRLSQLPGALRQREGEAPRGAASEADVRVDDVGPAKGDVLDKEPEHPLALPHRRLRIAPELREVGGEREDLGALLGVDDLPIGDALPLVFLLRGGERAQALVPLGLQRVRHETVVRIDLHVTAAGENPRRTGRARPAWRAGDRPRRCGSRARSGPSAPPRARQESSSR